MPSPIHALTRRLAFAALLLLAMGQGVDAQLSGLERIQPGDSVRVYLRGGLPVDAGFDRWQSGEMVLRVEGLEGAWFIDVEDLSELELYALRTNRESFRHGAVLGAVAGLFVGAVGGLLLHTTGVIDDPDAPPAQVITNAMSFAGIGVAVGIAGGGLYYGRNPGYGWVTIALPVR